MFSWYKPPLSKPKCQIICHILRWILNYQESLIVAIIFLRMYCIVRPMVPESDVPCTYHCLHVLSILVPIGCIVKAGSWPPLNINAMHKCLCSTSLRIVHIHGAKKAKNQTILKFCRNKLFSIKGIFIEFCFKWNIVLWN